MIRSQKRLGEMLVEKGLISTAQLNQALAEQAGTKEFLGRILVRNKLIKEQDFLEALSEQFNIPFLNLKNTYIDWDFVNSFSASLILDYGCFPVKKDDWSVTFAITNPLDVWALKQAEGEARGLKLKFVLTSNEDMQALLKRYQQYRRGNIPKLFK